VKYCLLQRLCEILIRVKIPVNRLLDEKTLFCFTVIIICIITNYFKNKKDKDGQFEWGVPLLKNNGGIYKSHFNRKRTIKLIKDKNVINCENYNSNRNES
jgi:uncharacterized protein YegP (UPF0339 family)